jgi:predicted RNA polymerase sigma factor
MVTRRITRAKQSIKASGVPFAFPDPDELGGRLDTVLRVLYLIFNEGYASTAGTALVRVDLADEAIRLTRTLHAALPHDGEVAGLLALMLLVHARHRSRTAPDGSLIPMAEQDRSLWDRNAIEEGIELVTAALPRGPTGPYQLQAAIAAVHDEAENPEATDWAQIVALYGVLLRLDDNNPVVALNHAVAVSMVAGPRAGLELIQRLGDDPRVNGDRRFHAVRGHLLEMAGDGAGAAAEFAAAAAGTANLRERHYLTAKAASLGAGGADRSG